MSFIDDLLPHLESLTNQSNHPEYLSHTDVTDRAPLREEIITSPRTCPPPSSDLPIRRRPTLSQSRSSPYPYTQDQTQTVMQTHTRPFPGPGPGSKISRPRPGLNRTHSFCPSTSGETYASASRPVSPGTPPVPGRLSKPLERLASGEVMAPSMERSMSSLGIDGWTTIGSTHGTTGRRDTRYDVELEKDTRDEVCQETARLHSPNHIETTLQVSIPMIVIDSPGKTSRPVTQLSPALAPPLSTSTPGFERYSPSFSDSDADWTPGPYTPDTPAPASTSASASALPSYLAGNKKAWGLGKG